MTLSALFRRYRSGILLTYALLLAENGVALLQPYCVARAIDDVLAHRWLGLALLAGQSILHVAIGTGRRAYDTRTFTAIYTELAAEVVEAQHGAGVPAGKIAGRTALSRELVDFFEVEIPEVVRAAFGIVGALVLLALYDVRIAALCLTIAVPVSFLVRRYARQTESLNRGLNDQLEREVAAIEGGAEPSRRHFALLRGWRVRLSDVEAVNFAGIELFVIALFCAAVPLAVGTDGRNVGTIYAVLAYVDQFAGSFYILPYVVQQVTRTGDISRRLTAAPEGDREDEQPTSPE